MNTLTASGSSTAPGARPASRSPAIRRGRRSAAARPTAGRCLPVAVHQRVLEEVAGGDHRLELGGLDEVVVLGVALARTRCARGERDRQADVRVAPGRRRPALTMLDFPAPDGAATMYRVPRMGFSCLSSMFWICSRTWSISTFSSTAALLVRASTDLLPRVFASRLNSCSGSRGGARPAPAASARGAVPEVAVGRSELLVHVELLQPQHQFPAPPAGIRRLRQVGQPRLQLLPLPGAGSQRHQRAHLGGDRGDGIRSDSTITFGERLCPRSVRRRNRRAPRRAGHRLALQASGSARPQHAGELQPAR